MVAESSAFIVKWKVDFRIKGELMRPATSRQPWLATIVLIATVTTSLAAHDFWIEPSTFEAAVGEPVRVHLRVGERFAGDPVARNHARIQRFVLVGPSGEQAVLGRDGMDPAGLLRLDAPGIWFVGYRSTPSPVELPAPAFERYLREEGLDRIIEERATRKENQAPGRERFSRSVKALLRTAGPKAAAGYDRTLGLTLELVLDADPIAAAGRLPLRLLHENKPLEGALVVAFRKTSTSPGKAEERNRGRTDAQGRITIPVDAGVWLVKAVHMHRAQPGSGADWESVWTSLTFQVP